MADARFYQSLGPKPLFELLDGLAATQPQGRFAEILINNAAPLDAAKAGEISFLGAKARKPKMQTCAAEAVLVTQKHVDAITAYGALPIVTPYPRADFAKILSRLYQAIPYEDVAKPKFDGVRIGQNAVIGQNATIGKGSIIGPGAVIGPGVIIGENCNIGANAVVEFTIMGRDCDISGGAVLGGDGFGVAADAHGSIAVPHIGRVVLGDRVGIGAQSCVDRAMFGDTKIGSGTRIDNLVQIGHNCTIGENCMFAGHTGISGSCVIGNNVIMGGNVGLADHTTVGDNVVMAANSATMRDIDAGAVVAGIPAMPIRDFMRQVSAISKLTQKKKT